MRTVRSPEFTRRLVRLAARVAASLRAMMGVPDYDRYLAHHLATHAGSAPLDRAGFNRRQLEQRYARPGARCC